MPNQTFEDKLSKGPTNAAIKKAKMAALYNISEISHADSLVGTSFEYTVSSWPLWIWITVDCKASAYPAKVKSIGAAKPIILDTNQVIRYVNPNTPLTDYSRTPSQIIENLKR